MLNSEVLVVNNPILYSLEFSESRSYVNSTYHKPVINERAEGNFQVIDAFKAGMRSWFHRCILTSKLIKS